MKLNTKTSFSLFIVAILMIMIPGCHHSGIGQDSAEITITGRWEWVKSVDSGNFETTPETEGYTIVKEFTEDSLFTYVDDTLSTESPFTMEVIEESDDQLSGWLQYPLMPSDYFLLERQTLTLTPAYLIGFTDYFTRLE